MSFIHLILERWRYFAAGFILSVVFGLLYGFFEKPKFESRLTFSLDQESGSGTLSSAMNLAAQFGLGMGSMQSMFDGDNIVEIMKSRKMVERVFLSTENIAGKNTTLANYYLETSALRKVLEKKDRLKNIDFPAGIKKNELNYLQDSILFVIYDAFTKNNLVVSRPDKKLSIYEVKIKSENEQFSKIFTERIVDTTSKFYIEITSKKEKETLDILEERVASIKNNVSTSIDERAQNMDVNLNPAFAQPQTPVLKQQYNIQAYSDAYREMFKNLEMARYQYLKKIPLLQIIDPAEYPMRKIKVGKLKACLVAFFIIEMLIYLYFRFSRKNTNHFV